MMESKKMDRIARLSTAGLANIVASKFENDFTFIVGGDRHTCPAFVAAFLSPRICRLQAMDPSFCEIEITTADVHSQFGDFLSLGRGCSVLMTDSNSEFFISIAGELENFELYWELSGDLGSDVPVASFCDRFQDSAFFESPLISEEVISFIASHFSEISESFLIGLPISTLALVLSQDSLHLSSEDSLYDFVISRFGSRPDSTFLLEHIRYEYLSEGKICEFVEWSFDHFEMICGSIEFWRRLSVRLSLSVSPSLPNSRLHTPTFLPEVDGSLDGIIAHLSSEFGGNVHDQGIVNITSRSVISDSALPKLAADLQSMSHFHSQKAADQWICYDFKDWRVRPTNYSIRANSSNYFLRSWIFEGSMDGLSWSLLDDQKDNSTANSTHPIATFSISQSSAFRFLRLRQTGKNANGNDYLVLVAFEIFGDLIGSGPK
jgi:hypothetical protein